MEELLALLGLGGGGLLVKEAYDKLGDIGDTAWTESQQIGQDANDLTNFTGYGVTGPTGSGQVDPTGNLSLQLSDSQQTLQNAYEFTAANAIRPVHPLNTYGTSALGAAEGMIPGLSQVAPEREQ